VFVPGAPSRIPLVELTVLSQTLWLDLRGCFVAERKGREGKKGETPPK